MYIKLIFFYYFQGAPATSVHTRSTSTSQKGQKVKIKRKKKENKKINSSQVMKIKVKHSKIMVKVIKSQIKVKKLKHMQDKNITLKRHYKSDKMIIKVIKICKFTILNQFLVYIPCYVGKFLHFSSFFHCLDLFINLIVGYGLANSCFHVMLFMIFAKSGCGMLGCGLRWCWTWPKMLLTTMWVGLRHMSRPGGSYTMDEWWNMFQLAIRKYAWNCKILYLLHVAYCRSFVLLHGGKAIATRLEYGGGGVRLEYWRGTLEGTIMARWCHNSYIGDVVTRVSTSCSFGANDLQHPDISTTSQTQTHHAETNVGTHHINICDKPVSGNIAVMFADYCLNAESNTTNAPYYV